MFHVKHHIIKVAINSKMLYSVYAQHLCLNQVREGIQQP